MDARGIGAVAYLAMFGGIVGYSAFVFSMAQAAGRGCVDLQLRQSDGGGGVGMAVLSRTVRTCAKAIAMVIIFIGVAIVKRQSVAVQKLGADRAAESGQYGE